MKLPDLPVPVPKNGFEGRFMEEVAHWMQTNFEVLWYLLLVEGVLDIILAIAIVLMVIFL